MTSEKRLCSKLFDFSAVRRESLKEMERLEMEAESLRSANGDQRRHIDILEQALNNAQGKVVGLEEEVSCTDDNVKHRFRKNSST